MGDDGTSYTPRGYRGNPRRTGRAATSSRSHHCKASTPERPGPPLEQCRDGIALAMPSRLSLAAREVGGEPEAVTTDPVPGEQRRDDDLEDHQRQEDVGGHARPAPRGQ